MTDIKPSPACTCPSGDGSLRHPCPAHIVECIAGAAASAKHAAVLRDLLDDYPSGGGGSPSFTLERAALAAAIAALVSTPAAPGIDLEQFQPAVCAMGLFAEEPADVDEAKRLLALIDASPKSGSDAQDAARYRKLKVQPQSWMLEYMRASRPHGKNLDAALDALPPISQERGSDLQTADVYLLQVVVDGKAWEHRWYVPRWGDPDPSPMHGTTYKINGVERPELGVYWVKPFVAIHATTAEVKS